MTTHHPFDTSRFGQAVEAVRRGRRLTVRDAADQAGVAASTLHRLEHGHDVPSVQTVAAVAAWADLALDPFTRKWNQ